MKPFALQALTALSLSYAASVAALANLPAWRYLPDLPMSISAASCPSAPITLAADPERVIPLVLATKFERGVETPASQESCNRIAALVRGNAPAYYDYVPQRFICRSVRAHAHELWLEAGLWPGPNLWIIDGHATGAGREGFADELRAAGLQYRRVGEYKVEIVPYDGSP